MIYLDYNATTPVDPIVTEIMLPFFSQKFGNPSSIQHAVGREAAAYVDKSREQIGKLVNASPKEIIFTSGATEAINLAIKGLTKSQNTDRNKILVLSTEHKAVLEAAANTKDFVFEDVKVQSDGIIDLDHLKNKIDEKVFLVAIGAANSETGVIQPYKQISEIVHSLGAIYFCDATQAIGKIPFNMSEAQIDLVAFSSHKIYGPKGSGALIAKRSYLKQIEPFFHGGGQERGIRSGTINVPGVVGFGAAAELALKTIHNDTNRIEELRNKLFSMITNRIDGITVNGNSSNRLPNTLNIQIDNANGDAVMANLEGLAISSGSACQSMAIGPSHVLQAMGLSAKRASESLRFCIGRPTDEYEINQAVSLLSEAVSLVRTLSSQKGESPIGARTSI